MPVERLTPIRPVLPLVRQKLLLHKLIDQTSGNSLALVKKMIHEVQHHSLEAGLNYAAEENAKARAHDDCKKGIASFLNKTPLTW
jgi:methylglutaconyl-CoA hydratase